MWPPVRFLWVPPDLKYLFGLPEVILQGFSRFQKPEIYSLPAAFKRFAYIRSRDGVDENILILLHGLGDSHANFAKLFKQMDLPQTAGLAVTAPDELPLNMGYTWFPAFEPDGELIIYSPGERRRLDGLSETRKRMEGLIENLLQRGWRSKNIFLLGFSQGGTVALDLVCNSSHPLGGVVAVAATLLEEQLRSGVPSRPSKRDSPVLLLHGSHDSVVPLSLARLNRDVLKGVLQDVVLHELPKEHIMISSASEMQLVMKFFSAHLCLRSVALETMPGVVEITPSLS
mmetsp:Transcript_16422/g.28450  ORF Transcript_16422/g.28450 Transcript_16422/m.28450 type:complete len:286 (+) Transcript_16422:13-870(+)|eukprot:CAMPEP_0196656690 /NCGR_PEP_ID=MMETSP1086-20130531/19380_1 /TAXON_ID=77921 /ORGANISM="Cyanoptyche  gloeocystis , Strain SAG4.97" /LENGTH=285 /DNA_ID=CAMNT_0041989539 /DNA_START=11 /DNA_END=868 /DNA_ORIENTATION=+